MSESVHIINTLPRPYSIPYQGFDLPEGQKEAFSITEWLQLAPGVSLDIDLSVWDRIKNHPDVRVFLDERSLIVTRKDVASERTEDFDGGVTALTAGALVSELDQPVPINQAKTTTLNTPVNIEEKSTAKVTK
jgi:hypothetical protein